jgi:hypothetical protein
MNEVYDIIRDSLTFGLFLSIPIYSFWSTHRENQHQYKCFKRFEKDYHTNPMNYNNEDLKGLHQIMERYLTKGNHMFSKRKEIAQFRDELSDFL